MTVTIISPSILSADFANLERDIKLVEANGADWIHVDVMDGHFVPNITIGIPVVEDLRRVVQLPLDVHLMIENPEKYAEKFINAGAKILTFHYEALNDISKSLDLIKFIQSKDCKAGISIKPDTKAEILLPFLYEADMVLIMTVEPGFGGQKFIEACIEKIEYIRKNSPESLLIQVDGGINAVTGKLCREAGANSLVAGSYIYKSSDIAKAILSLRN